ncbi:hypothetical protein BD626DRAFT_153215 [Schizophyllum amplum]|uniref:Uncharacterized protein n=1 Tax=Schizophyllum amplum TaxID=97359 RepID=A0A550C3F2_9AGAR|nr:hypothetical protein BD626DRAFT_153215 [Auriculariopsis ampla]
MEDAMSSLQLSDGLAPDAPPVAHLRPPLEQDVIEHPTSSSAYSASASSTHDTPANGAYKSPASCAYDQSVSRAYKPPSSNTSSYKPPVDNGWASRKERLRGRGGAVDTQTRGDVGRPVRDGAARPMHEDAAWSVSDAGALPACDDVGRQCATSEQGPSDAGWQEQANAGQDWAAAGGQGWFDAGQDQWNAGWEDQASAGQDQATSGWENQANVGHAQPTLAEDRSNAMDVDDDPLPSETRLSAPIAPSTDASRGTSCNRDQVAVSAAASPKQNLNVAMDANMHEVNLNMEATKNVSRTSDPVYVRPNLFRRVEKSEPRLCNQPFSEHLADTIAYAVSLSGCIRHLEQDRRLRRASAARLSVSDVKEEEGEVDEMTMSLTAHRATINDKLAELKAKYAQVLEQLASYPVDVPCAKEVASEGVRYVHDLLAFVRDNVVVVEGDGLEARVARLDKDVYRLLTARQVRATTQEVTVHRVLAAA